MNLSTRKIKFAWKYRRPLWKYRNLIRHRKPIAGAVLGIAAIGTGLLLKRALNS
jgi:hypothetical protein